MGDAPAEPMGDAPAEPMGDAPAEPMSLVDITIREWADRCRRLLATLDAARAMARDAGECICGLDNSPSGFRLSIVCPKHDGIFTVGAGELVGVTCDNETSEGACERWSGHEGECDPHALTAT